MLWWKKKKQEKKEPSEVITPKCPHTWKDFPWYMVAKYYANMNSGIYVIYEPYVCVHCHERKDVELTKIEMQDVSYKQFDKIVNEAFDRSEKHMKPREIVEDMINDFLFVDREKLAIIEKIRNTTDERNGGQ